jgi:hypothetical protein
MRTPLQKSTLAVLVMTSLVATGCGSASSQHAKTPTRSTGTTIATTTTRSVALSTTAPSIARPNTAIWPFAAGNTREADPVTAARSFAVTYLGFVDPVIGKFQQGDSRSGEVAVQAVSGGPVSTVLVRMLPPDDTWWVLGMSTPNLQLQSPSPLAAVTSPVTLTGQSTAFEATVNVQVRQDGTLTPLTEDIVMGGSNGQMGPFSKSINFPLPTAKAGAIVLKTISAKDGNVWEASVVRVAFSS